LSLPGITLIAIALLGEEVIATGRVITVLSGADLLLADLPEIFAGDALSGVALSGGVLSGGVLSWGDLTGGALAGDVFTGADWGFDDFADLIATDDLAEGLAAGLAGALCADALDFEGLFTDILATEPLAPFAQNRPLQTTSANRARRGPLAPSAEHSKYSGGQKLCQFWQVIVR